MPTVSWMPIACATTSLVPTPSVDEARIGLRYLEISSRNSPANPPMSPITSGRSVRWTLVFSSSTACSPAWMETPASAYVTVRRRPRPLPADQSVLSVRTCSEPGVEVAAEPAPLAPALFLRSDTCVTFSPYASRLPPPLLCRSRGQQRARDPGAGGEGQPSAGISRPARTGAPAGRLRQARRAHPRTRSCQCIERPVPDGASLDPRPIPRPRPLGVKVVAQPAVASGHCELLYRRWPSGWR